MNRPPSVSPQPPPTNNIPCFISDWGIDSLKMDGCNSIHTHAILDPAYEFMGDALNKTGRPVLYSCSWPDYIRSIAPGAGAAHNNTVDYGTEKRLFSDTNDLIFAKTGSGQT